MHIGNSKIKKLEKSKGFTFIELIIYVAIVAVLFTSLVQYALSAIHIGAKSATQQDVSESARYISERINYEIRNAKDVDVASSNFGVNLALTSGTKLVLRENPPFDPTTIDVVNGKVRMIRGVPTATPTGITTPTPTSIIAPTATPTASPTQIVTPTPTPASSATINLRNGAGNTYQTFSAWETATQAGQNACSPNVPRTNDNWPSSGAPPVCPGFAAFSSNVFDVAVNDLGITRVKIGMVPAIESKRDYFTEFIQNSITEHNWVHVFAYSPIDDDCPDPPPTQQPAVTPVPCSVSTRDPNSINLNGFKFSSLDYEIETFVIPIRNRVLAKGQNFYFNLNFVHFSTNYTGYYQYNDANEYAELMLATFTHLQQKYGFVPDFIEIELEPDNTNFDSTKMGNAIVATRSKLLAAGFNPKYIVPSDTDIANVINPNTVDSISGVFSFDRIKKVLNDNGLSVPSIVKEISYHTYRWGANTPACPIGTTDLRSCLIQSIGDRSQTEGIGASMLEHIGANYNELYTDLTLGMNSAWTHYSLVTPYEWTGGLISNVTGANGGSFYWETDNTTHAIDLIPAVKVTRQYIKYIKEGAVRITADNGPNVNYVPVAFINPDGTYAVVVKVSSTAPFSIGGLPAGTYGITYTLNGTTTTYGIALPDQIITAGQNLTTSMPAVGVLTVYGKTVVPTSTPTPTSSPTSTPPAAPTNTPTPPLTPTGGPTPTPLPDTTSLINSLTTAVTNLTFTNNISPDGKTKNISFTLSVGSAYLGARSEFKDTVILESSAELRSN